MTVEITLFRPVGPKELALIAASGYREFPPRLPEQPIFYPVLNEAYGEFSNFSPHPITMDGRVWSTSEHYFQAQKFVGTDHEETIRKAKSPMIAARLGRSRAHPLRVDWEIVKDDIMRESLRAKFT